MISLEHLFFSIWPLLIIIAWIFTPITLVVVIKSKETFEKKILNCILTIFVPIIGSILVLIMLFRNRKRNQNQ